MTTGGYTLLEAPLPTQKLVHIHAGAEELGRVYAADLLLQSLDGVRRRRRSRRSAPPTAALGRLDRRRRMPTTWPTWSAAPVEPLDMAVVVKTIAAPGPGGHRLHQRRRQLQRLAASLLPLPGLQHDGRTQLAPTSGAMGYGVPAAVAASLLHPRAHASSTSPATATS